MTIRINGEPIPEEAVEYELKRLVKLYSEHLDQAELTRQMGPLRDKAREQAVGAKLLLLESQKLDLNVAEKDVDQRLATMIENAGGPEKFDAILARQNMTRSLVREKIREGRKVDLLVERIAAEMPEPTEDDMRAHFDAHLEEYMVPEQARAQHILIKPETDSEADRAVACSRLQEIKARVGEGASFGDEAAAHSDCPSGKASGGSLGWIAKGAMLPQIDETVFSLKDGEISDVIESPLGLHILMKTEHEDRRPPEYETVRDKIRDFLRHAWRGEAIAAYVRDLKAKAEITED